MGRKSKEGLSYIPLDVDIFSDDKILTAQEHIDPDGKAIFLRFCVPYIMVRLLIEVFTKSYYLEWDDRVCRLTANNIGNGVTAKMLGAIINTFFDVGLLDGEKFAKYGVLTSHGIQKRWLLIMKLCRRKVLPIKENYNLLEKKPAKTKKCYKLEKKIHSEEMKITSEVFCFPATGMQESSEYLPKLSRFPFYINKYKSNSISRVEYNENISNFFKKERENSIKTEEIEQNDTEKEVSSVAKRIHDTVIPITSEVIHVPVALKDNLPVKIEFDTVDLQLLHERSDKFKDAWLDWVNYSAHENGKYYKSLVAKRTAIEELMRLANYDDDTAIKIIKKSISATWKIFFPLDAPNNQSKTGPKKANPLAELEAEIAKEKDPEKKKELRKNYNKLKYKT